MDCPLQDSLLHVHYKGMLLNEEKTVFYDTKVHNNDQPFEFRSGEGLVSHIYYLELFVTTFNMPYFASHLYIIDSEVLSIDR